MADLSQPSYHPGWRIGVRVCLFVGVAAAIVGISSLVAAARMPDEVYECVPAKYDIVCRCNLAWEPRESASAEIRFVEAGADPDPHRRLVLIAVGAGSVALLVWAVPVIAKSRIRAREYVGIEPRYQIATPRGWPLFAMLGVGLLFVGGYSHVSEVHPCDLASARMPGQVVTFT